MLSNMPAISVVFLCSPMVLDNGVVPPMCADAPLRRPLLFDGTGTDDCAHLEPACKRARSESGEALDVKFKIVAECQAAESPTGV